MAAHTTYLLRRGATLVFRRRVPKTVRPFYGKIFFALSLRTHLLVEARRRAAIATRFTDDLIGLIEACGANMLVERQYDAVIDTLIRVEIDLTEALRETAGARTPDAVAASIQVHEATRETLRAALIYNDYMAIEAPLERILARLGLSVERAGAGWSRLARQAARALIEVAEENMRREQGIYASDDRLSRALPLSSLDRTPRTPTAVAPTLPPAPEWAPVAAPVAETPSSRSSLSGDAHRAAGKSGPVAPERLPAASPRRQESRMGIGPSAEDPQCELPVRTSSAAQGLQPVCAGASEDRAYETASSSVRSPAPPAARLQELSQAPRPSARIATEAAAGAVEAPLLTPQSRFTAAYDVAVARKREECPGWDTNNLKNWNATRKLFLQAYGDRELSFYDKPRLLEFRALLCALPKNHHESCDAPGLYEIIDTAEETEARQLALARNEIDFCGLNRGEAGLPSCRCE